MRALDAATGATIWEYKRPGNGGRSKTLGIFQDLILYAAPDSYVVGIGAQTGEMRWQSKVETRGNSSGPLVVDGKLMFVGLFSDGFHLGCFVGDAWLSLERVFLKDASTDATGEMRMEWTRKLNYLEQMVDPD